jgi:hypothetical protein
LGTVTLSTRLFSYKTGTGFVAEASDLPESYQTIPHRFILKSHRTGSVKEFLMVGRDRDSDGDIQGWRYITQDGLKLLVIND